MERGKQKVHGCPRPCRCPFPGDRQPITSAGNSESSPGCSILGSGRPGTSCPPHLTSNAERKSTEKGKCQIYLFMFSDNCRSTGFAAWPLGSPELRAELLSFASESWRRRVKAFLSITPLRYSHETALRNSYTLELKADLFRLFNLGYSQHSGSIWKYGLEQRVALFNLHTPKLGLGAKFTKGI